MSKTCCTPWIPWWTQARLWGFASCPNGCLSSPRRSNRRHDPRPYIQMNGITTRTFFIHVCPGLTFLACRHHSIAASSRIFRGVFTLTKRRIFKSSKQSPSVRRRMACLVYPSLFFVLFFPWPFCIPSSHFLPLEPCGLPWACCACADVNIACHCCLFVRVNRNSPPDD